MSKIALSGSAAGAGTFTLVAPNSDNSYTLNLPQVSDGTLVSMNASGNAQISNALGIGMPPSGTFSIETASSASFGGNTYVQAGIFRTVGGGSAAQPSIQPGNDADTGMWWPGSNQLGFTVGGSNVLSIASGGAWVSGATPSLYSNGTTSAVVSATSGSYALALTQYVTGESYCQSNGGPFFIGTSGSQIVSFRTNATEAARITSGGYFCMGTTSTDTTTPGVWGGYGYAAGSGYGRLNFIKGTASGTGATSTIAFFYNGTTIGTINNTSTATTYNTSSDYRLKENVEPMTGAVAKLQQLNPVTFTWKSTGEAAQGFIAHELQEVFPDAVTGEKDGVELVDQYDEAGNVIGQQEEPKYQGIDTSFLVATLVKAIQEQQEQINQLKAEIATLKSA